MKPDLEIKKLSISNHATERALERFNCKDKSAALNYCKSLLGNAKYIGIVTSEDGGKSHMYAAGNTGLYVSTDLQTVKSIVDLDSHGHYEPLKSKIEALYHKGFRKTDRLEQARTRKLERQKIETELLVAQLNYRMYRTRSKNVKIECIQRIKEAKLNIDKCEDELKQIQSNKRQIARAIATIL